MPKFLDKYGNTEYRKLGKKYRNSECRTKFLVHLPTSAGSADASQGLAGYVRESIVGADSTFLSPFGRRRVLYCDYTASGRAIRSVEHQSWVLEVFFFNFFNDKKMIFFAFLSSLYPISAPVLFKKPTPSQISLRKKAKSFLYY